MLNYCHILVLVLVLVYIIYLKFIYYFDAIMLKCLGFSSMAFESDFLQLVNLLMIIEKLFNDVEDWSSMASE